MIRTWEGLTTRAKTAARNPNSSTEQGDLMRRRMSRALIESDNMTQAVELYYKRFRSSTKAWSFCLYSSLFGAAVLSAWAGVLPQLDSNAKDIATVLAVTASLINTITGIGRFDQKWQASRKARAETEALHIAMVENSEQSGFGKQLEQIIINQSAGIIGSHSVADIGLSSTPPERRAKRPFRSRRGGAR